MVGFPVVDGTLDEGLTDDFEGVRVIGMEELVVGLDVTVVFEVAEDTKIKKAKILPRLNNTFQFLSFLCKKLLQIISTVYAPTICCGRCYNC